MARLPHDPPHNLAQSDHLWAWVAWIYSSMWAKRCSREVIMGQIRSWSPPEKSKIHRMLDALFHHHRAWTQATRKLLKQPLEDKHRDILALLGIGLWLHHQQELTAQAVDHLVEASRLLHKPWSTALLNACLRRIKRESISLSTPSSQPWPNAWMKRLQQSWPEHESAILKGYQQTPELTLRHRQHVPGTPPWYDWVQQLKQAKIKHRIIKQGLFQAVRVPHGTRLAEIPGFRAFQVVVQDAGAQRLADYVQPEAGQCVLDACASPGGKTALLADRFPELESIMALDINASRIERLNGNLKDWGLDHIKTHCADAADTRSWWHRQPFDWVLIDAPCSGSGVVSKHPEIPWVRGQQALNRHIEAQHHLVRRLWPTLKAGGTMVYMTCSVFQEENDGVVQQALDHLPGSRLSRLKALPGWLPTTLGVQCLPHADHHGFYLSLLKKVNPSI